MKATFLFVEAEGDEKSIRRILRGLRLSKLQMITPQEAAQRHIAKAAIKSKLASHFKKS